MYLQNSFFTSPIWARGRQQAVMALLLLPDEQAMITFEAKIRWMAERKPALSIVLKSSFYRKL